MAKLPLYSFFQALRKHGFAMGVDDYGNLLEALNGGFGLKSDQDLLQLCRLLWFKPNQSWELFQDQFWRAFRNEKSFNAGSESTRSLTGEPKDSTSDEITDFDEPTFSRSDPQESSSGFESSPTTGSAEEAAQSGAENQYLYLSIASSAELSGGSLPPMQQIEQHISQYEFVFQGRYQAINSRQLQNSWRYLPERTQKRPLDEINIPATVERIARTGSLEKVVFKQESLGLARLLVLLDFDGSMVAFHDLAQQIATSAPKTAGKLPTTYYFHDIPGPKLFRDPDRTQADEIMHLAPFFIHRKASILIVSDAGAARGRYDRQRVLETQSVLRQLRKLGQHIVWLNPVPQSRWEGSSAEQIARLLVPMFEVNEGGMQKAINLLRGQSSGSRL